MCFRNIFDNKINIKSKSQDNENFNKEKKSKIAVATDELRYLDIEMNVILLNFHKMISEIVHPAFCFGFNLC